MRCEVPWLSITIMKRRGHPIPRWSTYIVLRLSDLGQILKTKTGRPKFKENMSSIKSRLQKNPEIADQLMTLRLTDMKRRMEGLRRAKERRHDAVKYNLDRANFFRRHLTLPTDQER